MAATEPTEVLTLKVLFDKVGERVVYAESNSHLVDILFSFLTLPMGTIILLLRNIEQQKPHSLLPSLNSLYEGLENLDVQHFITPYTKSMLTRPKNPSQAQCWKLKLNLDGSLYRSYFLCEDCYVRPNAVLKFNRDGKCPCGKFTTKEMYMVDDYVGCRDERSEDGVFVKESETFIITDDLQVMPSSTATSLQLLRKLGFKNVSGGLKEKIVDIGLNEVSSLLRLSLISKTALTDLILLKYVDSCALMSQLKVQAQSRIAKDTVMNSKKITLKLMLTKYNNKLLYAETQEDFVNYLLTLPAITLGSMAKLLDETRSLGCISNLYRSVEGLSANRHMKSVVVKTKLLSPKLGLQVARYSQSGKYQMMNKVTNCCMTINADPKSVIHMNAESPTLETIGDVRIIKGPTTYLVTDDLVVTPLSQVSSMSFLSDLNVPISELEVRVVTFGKKEAQRLLEASLISKSALTDAFNLNVSRKKLMLGMCGLNF